MSSWGIWLYEYLLWNTRLDDLWTDSNSYGTYLDSLQMKTAKNWALLKVFIPPQLSPIDALLSQFRHLLFIHMRTCMFVDCSAYRISIWWNDILQLYTVDSILQAAASIHFDEIFAQNLLSKKFILLRLLFEGGFY